MNHLSDANKMVSETPISDSTPHNVADLGMQIRRLERQLNAANERIKRLEAVTNDPHALWTNWLRGDVKLPVGIGDVRQYQERIKRLEEAGDNLHFGWIDGYMNQRRLDEWLKAKEAKL